MLRLARSLLFRRCQMSQHCSSSSSKQNENDDDDPQLVAAAQQHFPFVDVSIGRVLVGPTITTHVEEKPKEEAATRGRFQLRRLRRCEEHRGGSQHCGGDDIQIVENGIPNDSEATAQDLVPLAQQCDALVFGGAGADGREQDDDSDLTWTMMLLETTTTDEDVAQQLQALTQLATTTSTDDGGRSGGGYHGVTYPGPERLGIDPATIYSGRTGAAAHDAARAVSSESPGAAIYEAGGGHVDSARFTFAARKDGPQSPQLALARFCGCNCQTATVAGTGVAAAPAAAWGNATGKRGNFSWR